jgi:CTP-dependent riboflavin kinase
MASFDVHDTQTVVGLVTSGRGIARAFVGENQQRLKETLGADLVEGSLNVVLQRPLHLRARDGVMFGNGGRFFWPAMIGGRPVWASRWRHSPLHVLELFSDVRLRDALNLRDSDRVAIALRRTDVAPLSMAARIAWMIWWEGRQGWYYTGDRYKEHAKKWCRHFAATQSGV